MREGVRPKTKLYVICVMLCYVMLCVRLLRSWISSMTTVGHDNRGDRPTEVLLMAAYGERGVLDRQNMS